MRILILGAGGIGGYFGARLQQAGADVSFLVREARAQRLRDTRLRVWSPLGDVQVTPELLTAVAEGNHFDLVLLSCKAYDLASATDAIAPAVGPHSVVVPLLNGIAHLDELDARFGRARVAGGVAHLALTVDETGAIRHLNATQRLIIGARTNPAPPALDWLGALVTRMSPDYTVSAGIEQDMWDKLVFISVLAGATCLMRASIGDILDTRAGRSLIEGMLDESAAIATAGGHAPSVDRLAGYRTQLTEAGSTLTASMLRDVLRGAPTEADHVLGDLVRRAGQWAVPTPRLDLALSALQAYEAARRRLSESSGLTTARACL
ncbi:2-dehydropantoate 2-reductase family protein [Methyloversatilis sp. RAC08]|uniref:ketopantoate reductase family protein n=1 Tax=Methyloversatilis sp. RAC08 TaxID=1842540 RepID=UPI00083D16F0|nr:ketopantoate reductase family protein [Methyloversatilis sp. RAC08]AOF80443.1 2-dehydropantoate 2-reductase family protein [Methyloversatilis sp. RAC08]